MKVRIIFPLRMFLLLCLLLQTVSASNKSQAASQTTTASLSQFPEGQNIQMVGHFGGQLRTVFVQGQYAYGGFANELAVLDISTPTDPLRVGYLVFTGTIDDVYVQGNFAYVIESVLYVDHFCRIDILDPHIPKKLDCIDIPGMSSAVVVKNGYAYIASGDLSVVDISNSIAMHKVESACVDCSVNDIASDGNTIYLTSDLHGFYIFDISSPATPIQLSHLEFPEQIKAVSINENYAYIVSGDGLRVVEVSNPKDPYLVSDYALTQGMTDVVVTGVFAYVTNFSLGFAVLDVGNPARPTWNGKFISTGLLVEIALGPGFAYLAAENNGLRIISLADPYNPIEVNSYTPPAFIRDVVVEGNKAYTADSNGLSILDISNSAMPLQIGNLSTTRQIYHLVILDDYAYLAESDGIRVVKISHPDTPEEIGFLSVYPGKMDETDIAVAGSSAYLVKNAEPLRVIDISNPSSMSQVAEYPFPATGIAIVQQRLFIAGAGLSILDASNPSSLQLLGEYGLNQDYRDIEIQANYAYLASNGCRNSNGAECLLGLEIVDISNPASPVRAGTFPIDADIVDIKVSGKFIYILLQPFDVRRKSLLEILNISDITNPTEVGAYALSTIFPGGVFESDNFIYVADGGGLNILRYGSTITGLVLHENGSSFAGISITAGNGMDAVSDEQGRYQIANIAPGTFYLDPLLSGLVSKPASYQVTVPPDAVQQDFILLSAPVSTTLSPNLPTSLVYTDTLSRPTLLDIPAGAVTVTRTITLTPDLAPSNTWLSFSAHAFDLTVEQNESVRFNIPATLTIHYGQDDLHGSREESQLAVWLWQENTWQDPKHFCGSPSDYAQDLEANALTLPICQTGKYALFTPSYLTFLPLAFPGQ